MTASQAERAETPSRLAVVATVCRAEAETTASTSVIVGAETVPTAAAGVIPHGLIVAAIARAAASGSDGASEDVRTRVGAANAASALAPTLAA